VAFFLRPEGRVLSGYALRAGRRQARAVLGAQLLIGLAVAALAAALGGLGSAAWALAGAGIGIAATALMAFAMLRPGDGASAGRVAFGFFTGWLVKVGLTVALLIAAFRTPGVEAVPLLAAYAATFAGYWIGVARAPG
jgi:F0F1-type ATP synthase assembly protein I